MTMPTLKSSIDEQEKFDYFISIGYKYDPITGEVTNGKGKILGANKNGWYYFGAIAKIKQADESLLKVGVQSYNHRFAYYFMTGEIPNIIDHINRLRSDNRWVNLRNTDLLGNRQNLDTEVKGWYKKPKNDDFVYVSRINVNGKFINLGTFDTPTEAKNAYLQARAEIVKQRKENV